jgi:hypothetical protein
MVLMKKIKKHCDIPIFDEPSRNQFPEGEMKTAPA